MIAPFPPFPPANSSVPGPRVINIHPLDDDSTWPVNHYSSHNMPSLKSDTMRTSESGNVVLPGRQDSHLRRNRHGPMSTVIGTTEENKDKRHSSGCRQSSGQDLCDKGSISNGSSCWPIAAQRLAGAAQRKPLPATFYLPSAHVLPPPAPRAVFVFLDSSFQVCSIPTHTHRRAHTHTHSVTHTHTHPYSLSPLTLSSRDSPSTTCLLPGCGVW